MIHAGTLILGLLYGNGDSMKDIDRFYSSDYEELMSGGLIGAIWRQIHRQLDEPFKKNEDIQIIEVGSGNGQHFSVSSLKVREYVEVDLRANHTKEDISLKSRNANRRFIQGDATTLDFALDSYFDGLIATCLIAHLNDVRLALTNWRRVVKVGGTLAIYVPNEPGLFLRLARHFTTRRKILALGYDHENLHWNEHRNHFPLVRTLMKEVFANDEIEMKGFPIRGVLWDFNLYTIFVIKKRS